ncbi:MAG: hypothetical protein K9L98_04070 [Candidatus Pacebacteria bacterium]|nr:hypothetical protein [Candidatus Paceibacterota bacterium]MCF7863152.1 hypothetical protein [Candidatus Paceibacterota bacterium]
MKNKNNNLKNKEGGFLTLLILLVIAIILAYHYNVSFQNIVEWIKEAIAVIKSWF